MNGFKTPWIMKLFFVFFFIILIGGIIFNVFVFKDCTDRGHALYQCAAAMQNPHYVAVDSMDDGEDF